MHRVPRLSSLLLAVLVASPWGTQAGGSPLDAVTIHLDPSGADDTQQIQAALDAATAAGPDSVIELGAGTFRVGRPLIGVNLDVTIRGAGMDQTVVVADGSLNPDGLFQLVPPDEVSALETLPNPFLFLFCESDVDRTGQPVERRSQRIVMTDLSLGATGQTVPHFDINAGAETQRLFSLVWFQGYRPGWTNSDGETPADLGRIDHEQARVSTIEATFVRVHLDGMNRARTEDEPGDAFDPNPDVRNAVGMEGGFVLLQPPPDPVFFFKPVNGSIVVTESRFSDLPGQAGIFAPQLVGPDDPAWRFGPEAVDAGIKSRNTTFEDTWAGVLAGDLSDADVTVRGSTSLHTAYGVSLWANYQTTFGVPIGYPAGVPSDVKISGSTFEDTRRVAVWMDQLYGPRLVDLAVRENVFSLADEPQIGILGTAVRGARIVGNEFVGIGYAGIVLNMSRRWHISQNAFCDLEIPPSALARPNLKLPPNEAQATIVLVRTNRAGLTDNRCASM